jgi:hypothetical protein
MYNATFLNIKKRMFHEPNCMDQKRMINEQKRKANRIYATTKQIKHLNASRHQAKFFLPQN